MTRKEAIEILEQYHVNFEPYNAEDIVCAIGMAIEALEPNLLCALADRECPFQGRNMLGV